MKLIGLLLAGLALSAADAPRHHVETAGSSPHEYTLHLGGTVDAENTRDPIVYSAWKQGFEPMRYVRLENVGASDVVNPWILVNGKRNWRTAADIANEAIRTYGDPARMTAAEKVRAIWDFQRRHRFHATTGDLEVRDPVKLFNVYGYALCGDNAPALADLWRVAGFRTRRGFPIGHCVSEAWYDGAWHMLDADESVIFLQRDNRTIASEKEVARDHELANRAWPDKLLAAMYSYDGPHSGEYASHIGHTMNLTLRPGEAIEWRWDHAGKLHRAPEPALYLIHTDLKNWGENAWAALANGRWTYSPQIHNSSGPLTWKMEMPYAIVGGRLKLHVRPGTYIFRISPDNREWHEAARVEAASEAELTRSLDACFPNTGPAIYRYFLQAEWQGAAAGIEAITIENDLQMARLSLPELELGDNRIRYFDESKSGRNVRVTFDWVERDTAPPPAAPGALSPVNGSEVEGTRVAFGWRTAAGTVAYHFQLSDEPDLRFPLSPAFDVTLTAKPEFVMPSEGLLNPGQRYYWRVRAKSGAGVWGPWSAISSFVPQAPGIPRNLRIEPAGPDTFTLRWDPSPIGRPAAEFRIYAADEKGFTASDEPHAVATGNQKIRGLFPGEKSKIFPANRLATTTAIRFELHPRQAFYRVVAVDAKGNRSGASDYATGPRPFIYSDPPTEAKVGAAYRYEVKTIASIGDLTYRDFGPGESYQAAFWDADQPKFSLEVEMPRCGNVDPKWLHIDPVTGVISGKPAKPDAGEYIINVKVEIPGAGTYLQSYALLVGPAI